MGCEWDPDTDSPATNKSAHWLTTPEVWLVGAKGEWRLCAKCAQLSRFRRFRVRKRVKPPTVVHIKAHLDDEN